MPPKMSPSAVALLRPCPAKCLATATTGLLSVHIKSPSATVHLRAVVALRPEQQTRPQSTSSSSSSSSSSSQQQQQQQQKTDRADEDGRRPEKPDVSFRQFAGRALGVSLRNLAVALSPRGIRQAYRENPGLTTMNIVLLLFTLVFSAVAVRSYINTFYNAEFSRYPEPVANTLRRAMYYTNVKPEPELALKYYKKAMEQCAEVGLDPFSDEVLGIRIQVAYWLQKIGSYNAAIDVLESVLADCRRWIDVMEQSVREGKVNAKGRYTATATPVRTGTGGGVEASAAGKKEGGGGEEEEEEEDRAETLWAKRQRLLAKAISISVKLGELDVAKPDEAHAHLVWAVETALSELARRRESGTRPGESSWLRPEELGGAIESLGRDYERRSQFALAIPLFFQALRLCESPCHRAVIMNNLAASFAQSPALAAPGAAIAGAGAGAGAGEDASAVSLASLGKTLSVDMPTTRQECLDAGLNWARNAYTHARDVKGEERTAECDEACAVALCNWADVAGMLGKTALARSKYEECIRLSTKLDFADGEVHAREGLAKLATTTTTTTTQAAPASEAETRRDETI